MNPTQASLQLTIASGGRVILKADPAKVPPQDVLEILPSSAAVLGALKGKPVDVVICAWPRDRALCQELCDWHEVSVLLLVPVTVSRAAATAFARTMRGCGLLPASFSLLTLMGLAAPILEEEPSARFLRRLPRLTRLWGLRKTGIVQFLQSDGAWDWISLKEGALVQAGDVRIIRTAMQHGQMRFLERAVQGDGSREMMGRLLMELAGLRTDTRFAAVHRSWTPQPCRIGDIPVSKGTRELLAGADGHRSLRQLLGIEKTTVDSVSEELHALVRLRLAQLKPPALGPQPPLNQRLLEVMQREQVLLTPGAPGPEAAGLFPKSMVVRRKIARWKNQQYNHISTEPGLPGSTRAMAARLSGGWLEVFLGERAP